MNKFAKFPLVLGVTALICGAALSVVFEITNPIIKQRENAATIAAVKEIIPTTTDAKEVTNTFEQDLLDKYGVKVVIEVYTTGNTPAAYAYQVVANGYGGEMKFMTAFDAAEEKILGFQTISHSETNSGSYGGPLLNSPDFGAQFKDLAFNKVDSDIDFVAGSTAKITMSGVKKAVNNAISFHKVAVLGGEESTIALSDAEITKLSLPAGSELVDVTDAFKAKLQANKVATAVKEMNLLNVVDIAKAGTVTGHAYVSSFHLKIPEVGEQDVKLVFMFDASWANAKVVVVSTTDTLADANNSNYRNGEDYVATATSIADHPWINQLNGKSMTELAVDLEHELHLDTITGASFTSDKVKSTLVAIVSWHARANG